MKQAEHYPPTSSPEARYDAVVARGRSIERSARRRRALVSSGVAALVVVVIGGLCILSLKQRYEKIYMSEAVGSFAMYTVLVALFTSPVAEVVRNLIG